MLINNFMMEIQRIQYCDPLICYRPGVQMFIPLYAAYLAGMFASHHAPLKTCFGLLQDLFSVTEIIIIINFLNTEIIFLKRCIKFGMTSLCKTLDTPMGNLAMHL